MLILNISDSVLLDKIGKTGYLHTKIIVHVLYPGEGVCPDPRSGDSTFGVGGPGPPTMDNGSQVSLDRGEEKT